MPQLINYFIFDFLDQLLMEKSKDCQFSQIRDYIVTKVIKQKPSQKIYLVKSNESESKECLAKLMLINDCQEKYKKEAALLMTSDERHIIKIKDFFLFEREGFKYFVIILEYLAQNLESYLGQYKEEMIEEVMQGIAHGMKSLFDQHIVHRDLNLENIYIDANNTAKVGDLGFVKEKYISHFDIFTTTQYYCAPQTLIDKTLNSKSNIWTLGLIFTELIIGQKITPLMLGNHQLPGFLKEFPPKQIKDKIVNTKWKNIILQMLQKEPNSRLKIEQVLEMLQNERKYQNHSEEMQKKESQQEILCKKEESILQQNQKKQISREEQKEKENDVEIQEGELRDNAQQEEQSIKQKERKEDQSERPLRENIFEVHRMEIIEVQNIEANYERENIIQILNNVSQQQEDASFQCEMKDGKKHGKGIFIDDRGDKYDGNWQNDLRDGFGIQQYSNGDVYVGSFLHDFANGNGKYYDKEKNDIYEGQWKNDQRHGKGKQIDSEGNIFEGEWRYNQKNGAFLVKFADGGSYEGDFQNDERQGKGKLIDSEGTIYQGNFLKDQKSGYGIQTYSDGDIFEGSFKEDQPNGYGVFRSKTGSYQGNWMNGKRQGAGKQINQSKNQSWSWKGNFESNAKHGKGKALYQERQIEIQYNMDKQVIGKKKTLCSKQMNVFLIS